MKGCKGKLAQEIGAHVHDPALQVVDATSDKRPSMAESDDAKSRLSKEADVSVPGSSDSPAVVMGREVAIPSLGDGKGTEAANVAEAAIKNIIGSAIGSIIGCMHGACPPNPVDASGDGPHQPHHDTPHAEGLESL